MNTPLLPPIDVHPGLVLLFAESVAREPADDFLRAFHARVGNHPAVGVLDFRALKAGGFPLNDGGPLPRSQFERWLADRAAQCLRASGAIRAARGRFLVTVVSLLCEEPSRRHSIAVLPYIDSALRRIGLPAGLEPSILGVSVLPERWTALQAAGLFAWLKEFHGVLGVDSFIHAANGSKGGEAGNGANGAAGNGGGQANVSGEVPAAEHEPDARAEAAGTLGTSGGNGRGPALRRAAPPRYTAAVMVGRARAADYEVEEARSDPDRALARAAGEFVAACQCTQVVDWLQGAERGRRRGPAFHAFGISPLTPEVEVGAQVELSQVLWPVSLADHRRNGRTVTRALVGDAIHSEPFLEEWERVPSVASPGRPDRSWLLRVAGGLHPADVIRAEEWRTRYLSLPEARRRSLHGIPGAEAWPDPFERDTAPGRPPQPGIAL